MPLKLTRKSRCAINSNNYCSCSDIGYKYGRVCVNRLTRWATMNNHRKRGNRTELEALALFQKKSLKIMTACKIPVLFCCVTPGIPYRRFCVRYSRSHEFPVSLFLLFDQLALFVLFLVPWSQKTDNAHAPIGLHLSLIHIWRCRRSYACRSRWSPYH